MMAYKRIEWLLASLLMSVSLVDAFSSQFETRSECANFTAPNGLEFDVHCPAVVPVNWTYIHPWTVQNNINNCMDLCSSTNHCWSVLFNVTSGSCYISTEQWATATDYETMDDDAMQSGWATEEEISNYNTSCGFSDGTIHTMPSDDGDAQFQIYCDTELYGEDSYPWATPQYEYPYHAESLEDCMQQCVDTRPLCYGVSWNPDYVATGWANCWPKFGENYTLVPDTTSGGIYHSATLSNLKLSNTSCPSGKPTVDGVVFETKCDYNTQAANYSTIHAESMDGCMSACAANVTSSSTCAGVVFDSEMAYGYFNCYLMSAFGSFNATEGFHIAQVVDASGATTGASSSSSGSSSSSSSGDSSNSSSSSSKAWIAGPVIGAVAVIAGLIYVFWYRPRRNRNKAKQRALGSSVDNNDMVHDDDGDAGVKNEKKSKVPDEVIVPQESSPPRDYPGQMSVARYPAEMGPREPGELEAPVKRYELA